jgi:hypothetical protein
MPFAAAVVCMFTDAPGIETISRGGCAGYETAAAQAKLYLACS